MKEDKTYIAYSTVTQSEDLTVYEKVILDVDSKTEIKSSKH